MSVHHGLSTLQGSRRVRMCLVSARLRVRERIGCLKFEQAGHGEECVRVHVCVKQGSIPLQQGHRNRKVFGLVSLSTPLPPSASCLHPHRCLGILLRASLPSLHILPSLHLCLLASLHLYAPSQASGHSGWHPFANTSQSCCLRTPGNCNSRSNPSVHPPFPLCSQVPAGHADSIAPGHQLLLRRGEQEQGARRQTSWRRSRPAVSHLGDTTLQRVQVMG